MWAGSHTYLGSNPTEASWVFCFGQVTKILQTSVSIPVLWGSIHTLSPHVRLNGNLRKVLNL